MKNADEITIAANGSISIAPVGTEVETDPEAALDAAFVELGYVTEDGVTFNAAPELLRILAWQASQPVRQSVTSRTTTVAYQLQQWNADSFPLAFGGGEWVQDGSGIWRFDPPGDEDDLPEYVQVVDFADGDRKFRQASYRVNVTEGVETNLVRGGAAVLPITTEVLAAPEGVDRPWNIWSNDPAFNPGS
jgi:hypothetical protein